MKDKNHAMKKKAAIPFSKFSGSGNDFILIDNRGGVMKGIDRPVFAARVCDRARSVGADGLIIIEASKKADFRWDFYNADGSRAEMCGNGGRCAARFAFSKRIAGAKMSFETLAGIIHASVSGRSVKLLMPRPKVAALERKLTLAGARYNYSFIDTGVPHVVLFCSNLEKVDVAALGRAFRRHRAFAPKGANVNFVQMREGVLRVRTYERGVEGETLACGTGAVASALMAAALGIAAPPVSVKTSGGEILKVYFDLAARDFGQVFLEGDAAHVFDGRLFEEAYRY